ncbi:MAG: OmpA family protein [Burkholderiales bacterium]|nr:OmpA family protein [Burkholderiales bacterium]
MNRYPSARLRPLALASTLWLGACASPPAPPPPPPYRGPTLQIEQLDRGVMLVLPSSVLFDVNQASFKADAAKPYLDRVADLLMRKTRHRVSVEGHTDSDGTEAHNQALSEARAESVAEALVARGVDRSRIVTVGYSFNRPVASNATEDGKRLNRRVEIIVLGEKVATLTAGEPPGAFESAWARLKGLVDQGLVKPAEAAPK